jgi:hypothetical protein
VARGGVPTVDIPIAWEREYRGGADRWAWGIGGMEHIMEGNVPRYRSGMAKGIRAGSYSGGAEEWGARERERHEYRGGRAPVV